MSADPLNIIARNKKVLLLGAFGHLGGKTPTGPRLGGRTGPRRHVGCTLCHRYHRCHHLYEPGIANMSQQNDDDNGAYYVMFNIFVGY